jgi:excisionase family DNA binding protein
MHTEGDDPMDPTERGAATARRGAVVHSGGDEVDGSDAPPLAPDVLSALEALPPVLTIDELAPVLRIGRKLAYAAVKSGEIPGGRRIGGRVRIYRDAVVEWLRTGKHRR